MNLAGKITRGIRDEKRKYPGIPAPLLVIRKGAEMIRDKFRFWQMLSKKDSTFETEDVMYMCSLFPKRILDLILSDVKPATVLDVGCGTGVSMKYFIKNDIEAYGVENSVLAIERSGLTERITKHNLNEPLVLDKTFDLAWCFEVIEHIHPDYEDVIINTLTDHSDLIMLSAARPGQGGHGHFNEQKPEYWIAKFSEKHFYFDEFLTGKVKDTGETFSDNFLVFRRKH